MYHFFLVFGTTRPGIKPRFFFAIIVTDCLRLQQCKVFSDPTLTRAGYDTMTLWFEFRLGLSKGKIPKYTTIYPLLDRETIDRTLPCATTPGQTGPGSDGNEGSLCIPQSSSITEASHQIV